MWGLTAPTATMRPFGAFRSVLKQRASSSRPTKASEASCLPSISTNFERRPFRSLYTIQFFRYVDPTEGEGAIFREGIRIEQRLCFARQTRRGVEHTLVLQTRVLGKEIATAISKRHGVLLVIPERRQFVVDPFPFRNASQIIE